MQSVHQSHDVEFASFGFVQFGLWFLCSSTVTHVLAIICWDVLMLGACRDRYCMASCSVMVVSFLEEWRSIEKMVGSDWFNCLEYWFG